MGDIGIWLLSDRAVSLLVKRSYKEGKLSYSDMYSDFGLTLGEHPRMMDDDLNKLSVSILPLPGGEMCIRDSSSAIACVARNPASSLSSMQWMRSYGNSTSMAFGTLAVELSMR